jgi:hypothetical protein
MRERIAGAFVVLALALIVVLVSVRVYALQDFLADQEMAHQRDEAGLVAAVITDRVALGETVDHDLLADLVGIGSRLEYLDPDGGTTTAAGPAFDPSDGTLEVQAPAGEGTVVLTRGTRQLLDLSGQQYTSLIMLALLVLVLAGLTGWWLASRLAAPFSALARNAAALGRGRFDLLLPETRIPEAQAIGQALKVSAAQLEARLARERDFAEYASHELRTPLTALRMELEDLALRDDVPDDVTASANRCMRRVDDVDGAAGHLVSITRQGALVEGGQVPLRVLATNLTQAWSDRLAEERRTVTARADGDIDVTFTPGPVEHVLELVLDEVIGGEGPVRLRFVGNESHVRIEVPPGIAGPLPHTGLRAARELAEAQGGRVTGDLLESGLDILMPRR